jgi:hypothetical protein
VLAVRDHLDTLDPVDIAVVHFDQTDRLGEYRRFHRIPDRVRLLADPDRDLHALFAIGRGPWWRVWGPRTFVAYARLLRAGGRYRRHRGDSLQLGADIVIAADGTMTTIFRPSEPDDRPSLAALESALDSARA